MMSRVGTEKRRADRNIAESVASESKSLECLQEMLLCAPFARPFLLPAIAKTLFPSFPGTSQHSAFLSSNSQRFADT